MGFQSGPISCRMFTVLGNAKRTPDQDSIAALVAHVFKPAEIGTPEDIEYGWSAGRHLYDQKFSFEANVFADCLFFGLRIDNNAAPSAVKKSYLAMEEAALAAGNPSGFISKIQKREARETVARRVEDEKRAGKFRRSRVIPILYDFANATLYAGVSGKAMDCLGEIFERTFGCTLRCLDSGEMAAQKLGAGVEDLRPTRFVVGPEGEDVHPPYPWIARATNGKNFLGNEFLMWALWQVATVDESVFFQKSLELECAYGLTGRDVVKGDVPDKSPETREALRLGKVPRKAGMILGEVFDVNLAAESMSFTGLRLPDVEEADSPRQVFEERIGFLRDFKRCIETLFGRFLADRSDAERWASISASIGEWASATVPA